MGLLQTHEAEGVGFEPTEPFWGSPLFESGTLNHSDTLPPGSIAQAPILPQAVGVGLRSYLHSWDSVARIVRLKAREKDVNDGARTARNGEPYATTTQPEPITSGSNS
jgi:hypothetical protein